jgi:hypothetical protein
VAWSDDYKRTTRGRAITLLSNARKRCKERGVPLELSVDWVDKQLIIGACQITGIPFNLEPTPEHVTRRWDAPSLDRIDKNQHYTETNTRVVLWAVNCALAEYGTEIMLPILKAMIKGIENATTQPTTSVPTGHHSQSEIYPELGSFSAAGTREDYYDLDHYQRTISGQDSDYRTQTRGGDSVGQRGQEVGAPQTLESFQDDWQLHPAYGWIKS